MQQYPLPADDSKKQDLSLSVTAAAKGIAHSIFQQNRWAGKQMDRATDRQTDKAVTRILSFGSIKRYMTTNYITNTNSPLSPTFFYNLTNEDITKINEH